LGQGEACLTVKRHVGERPVFRLALVGFGSVAQAFVQLLLEKERDLPFESRICGVITRNFKLVNEQGLDLASLLQGRPPHEPQSEADILDFVANCPADVVLELTTLNPESGQPAGQHLETALLAGRHVITANKGPIAHFPILQRLRELSANQALCFRFEGVVMDGTPIFNLVERTLPFSRIRGFRGILNGTTNFILEELAAGRSFEEALAAAQMLGITEADPTHDLLGWDAAAKVAALANVLLEAEITPLLVERQVVNLADLPRLVKWAAARGKIVKQVAEAEWVDGLDDEELFARVSLQEFDPTDFMASMFGTGGLLTLYTDVMGRLSVVQHDGQVSQTAYALLVDLLEICRQP